MTIFCKFYLPNFFAYTHHYRCHEAYLLRIRDIKGKSKSIEMSKRLPEILTSKFKSIFKEMSFIKQQNDFSKDK